MYKFRNISAIFILASVFTFAQTSGPTQPDFMKFSQVEIGNNVNEFDGSFNYSIPVLSIPSGNKVGYSLQLTYQSGSKPNDEATWVGFGWSLNPGSILRQVKGFPDDFDDVKAKIYNKVKPTISVSDITTLNLELYSQDANAPKDDDAEKDKDGNNYSYTGTDAKPKLNLSYMRSFNNNTGYNYTSNMGMILQGYGGMNYSADNFGNKSFSLTVHPKVIFRSESVNKFLSVNDENWDEAIRLGLDITPNIIGSTYGPTNWGKGLTPLSLPIYEESNSYSFVPKFQFQYTWIGTEFSLPFLTNINTITKYKCLVEDRIFGFMYSGKAFSLSTQNKNGDNIQMDYYNEKESGLSMRNQNLPIPFANPDNFVVSGNGLNGVFKLHSKKMGMFVPKYIENKSNLIDWGFTLGIGWIPSVTAFLGVDGKLGWNKNSIGSWSGEGRIKFDYPKGFSYDNVDDPKNIMLYPYNTHQEQFSKYNSTRLKEGISFGENYFFKFANDLTYRETFTPIHDWDRFAGNTDKRNVFSPLNSYIEDDILKITNNNDLLSVLNSHQRVSRSSFIDYTLFGETNNTNTVNKFNISCSDNSMDIDYQQIDNYPNASGADDSKIKDFKIVNKDGATYHYGLIVNNSKEENASFVVDKIRLANEDEKYFKYNPLFSPLIYYFGGRITKDGITSLGNVGNTLSNLGKNDNNIQGTGRKIEETYGSAYLLTKILSTDYVDLTMDGPSIDDIGDYVIFHYRKTSNYKWREPYVGLRYSKNSNSDVQDDKASYSSGIKEIYYLESIETKTHIAVFVTNNTIAKDDHNVNTKFIFKMKSVVDDEIDLSILNGSGINRLDAYQALGDEYFESFGSDTLIENHMYSQKNILERLEKIVLLEKDLSRLHDVESSKRIVYITKKLQTVNFAYDETYPIWPNLINSKKDHNEGYPGASNGKKGKLTLTELWFDKEKVLEANVSKYKFNYFYPKNTGIDSIDLYSTKLIENPYYMAYNIDRWGCNADNQKPANEDLFPSLVTNPHMLTDPLLLVNDYQNSEMILGINRVNQRLNNYYYDSELRHYDPAAYNLKSIITPNKSETVIQYEQKDYAYVQNREAAVLFKLWYVDNNENGNHSVVLRPDSTLSISSSNLSLFVNKYAQFLKDSLIGKFTYFKYYYFLPKNHTSQGIFDCGFDYIDGYNKITDVDAPSGSEIVITFQDNIGLRKCNDFYLKRRNGLIPNNENCEPCQALTKHEILDNQDKVEEKFNEAKDLWGSPKVCRYVEPQKSYVRLPLPEYMPKKGGGVRVKRVYTIDNFDMDSETDDIVTNRNTLKKYYGNEYIYGEKIIVKDEATNTQGEFYKSYGVATNEPQLGGEENILKNYQPNIDLDNAIYSMPTVNTAKWSWNEEELDQNEGPYCESILPSPTVNYSKIIVKSLIPDYDNNTVHVKDNNNDNNVIVKEFNTVKDYPYDMEYAIRESPTSDSLIVKGNQWNNISKNNDPQRLWEIAAMAGSAIANNYGLSYLSKQLVKNSMNELKKTFDLTMSIGVTIQENISSFSQGYQFILNNMHGTPKRVATYSVRDFNNPLSWKLGSDVNYEYYKPGVAVPVVDNLDKLTVNQAYQVKNEWLGMTMEYANESRELVNIFNKVYTDVDCKLVLSAPPVPIFSANAGFQMIVDKYRYFTSNKIVNFPTLLKKQINTINGITTTTENIAFDPLTGEPVIKKTSDDYTGITGGGTNYTNNNYYEYDVKSSLVYDNDNALYNNHKMNYSSLPIVSNEYQHNFKIFSFSNPNIGITHYLKMIPNPNQGTQYLTCETMKLFHKDEILRLKKSVTTSSDVDLFFKIRDVQCNNISLQLLSPTQSSLDNVEVDFEVVKSKLSNNLSSTVAKIVTYNQDKIPNTNDYPSQLFSFNRNYSTGYIGSSAMENPLLLMNDLNNVIGNICNYTPPTLPTFVAYPGTSITNPSLVLTTRTLPSSHNYYIKNIEGQCETVSADSIIVKANLVQFASSTTPRCTLYIGYPIPTPYIYDIYHFVLEVSKYKKNINSEGFWSSQKFFSHAAFYSSTNIPNTPPSGVEATILPQFEFDDKFNMTFKRRIYRDLNSFVPSTLTSEVIESINDSHFNRSWCNYFAAFSFCNDTYLDMRNENSIIVKSNVSKLSDSVGTKYRSFRYGDFIKELSLGSGFTGFTYTISSDASGYSENTTDTDLDLSKAYCFNKFNDTLLMSSTHNKLISSHIYDNTTTAGPADEVRENVTQTNASNNVIVAPTYAFKNNPGVLSNMFQLYNWKDNSRNHDWITNQTLLYNNNLAPFAEKDVYDIPKGVTYENYLGIIPTMSVAKYNPKITFFEDFENYNKLMLHSYRKDKITFIAPEKNIPHTGSYSATLTKDELWMSVSTVEMCELYALNSTNTNDFPDYKVMLWVKPNSLGTDINMSNLTLTAKIYVVPKSNIWLNPYKQGTSGFKSQISSVNLKTTLQIGDWYLYEGIFPRTDIISGFSGSSFDASYQFVGKLGIQFTSSISPATGAFLSIDDVKLSPKDAETNCFVTDWEDGYKIKAVLDNNHVPLNFIYNQKGELKRKVFATTKGQKTISEEFFNIPFSKRNESYIPPILPMINEDNISNKATKGIDSKLNEIQKQAKNKQYKAIDKVKLNNITMPNQELNKQDGVGVKRNINQKTIKEALQEKDSTKNR